MIFFLKLEDQHRWIPVAITPKWAWHFHFLISLKWGAITQSHQDSPAKEEDKECFFFYKFNTQQLG